MNKCGVFSVFHCTCTFIKKDKINEELYHRRNSKCREEYNIHWYLTCSGLNNYRSKVTTFYVPAVHLQGQTLLDPAHQSLPRTRRLPAGLTLPNHPLGTAAVRQCLHRTHNRVFTANWLRAHWIQDMSVLCSFKLYLKLSSLTKPLLTTMLTKFVICVVTKIKNKLEMKDQKYMYIWNVTYASINKYFL